MTQGYSKIIVIEDDKDINELISYNLAKEGFSVQRAYDGIEAMEMLRECHYPIVVLDIMLPGLDGFDICHKIKEDEDYKRSFLVIVSAKASSQDKLHANILGADYYLAKPFNLTTFVSIVKDLNSLLHKEFTVVNK